MLKSTLFIVAAVELERVSNSLVKSITVYQYTMQHAACFA
jgi:phosphopantetheine adenylyltransferase